MTLNNAYATVAQVKAFINITDVLSDTLLENSSNAASRLIDDFTGWNSHGFWVDSSVVTQSYYAEDSRTVCIDDGIATATGLIVKTDVNDDGGFATTLTINTNFILQPVNALASFPSRPFTEIRLVDYTGTYFPRWGSGRPGVQITAKFGWPAVPDAVYQACLIQAVQEYNSKAASFGVLPIGDSGFGTRVGRGLHPMAESLLEGVSRPRVG